MKVMGSSIAHELRTPLASTRAAMEGIKRYLPILLDAYRMAKEARLSVQFIRPHHIEILQNLTDSVDRELAYANNVIDMLLMNIKYHDNVTVYQELNNISINKVIREALMRYPFKTNAQRQQITWKDPQDDFLFSGTEILIVHVLFNLLKNALYYIEAESKGDISIWLSATDKANTLHFKDTAKGISESIKDNLFKRFYTTSLIGTGIGLAFCKAVMMSFGGDITCESKEGEYTEFILHFPTI